MAFYPKANRTIKGVSSGPHLGGPYKGVLHTTEGSSASGAIGAFKNNNSWPHFLIDYAGTVWQFIDTIVGARALRNLSGGVQTNLDSAIQIELVGFAGKPNEHPPAQMAALKELMRWIEATTGVKPIGPGRPFATAYGQTQLRFTNKEWDEFAGWNGHCHVPENCVTPDARVLMADLTWKRAGSLVAGDEIVGFDDEPVLLQTQGDRKLSGRQYHTGVVEKNVPFIGQAVEVITANGRLTCTPAHPWLVWRENLKRHGSWQWCHAGDLQTGDQVAWFGKAWEVPETREIGWLSGMYDADGCMALNTKGQNYCMEVAQRSSEMVALDKVQAILKDCGIDSSLHIRPSPSSLGNSPMGYVRVLGGRPAIMRALGIVRPDRFIRSSYRQLWEGLHFKKGSTVHFDTIVSVEGRHDQPMAGVQTSLGTYIVEGWPQHQTHWDPGAIDLKGLLPITEVKAMYDPALNLGEVVASLPRPGGVVLLNRQGDIYAFNCKDVGAPGRHPEYWNRLTDRAAALAPLGDAGYYVIKEGSSTVEASPGWYGYPA